VSGKTALMASVSIAMRLNFTQFPQTEGYLALKKKLENGYSVRERLARALGVNF
jgi:hypothetical protein